MITRDMPSRTRLVMWAAVLPVLGIILMNVGAWFGLCMMVIDGAAMLIVGLLIQTGYLMFLRMESRRMEARFVATIKEMDARRNAFIKRMRELL